MRIITVNLPFGMINTIAKLTGENGLFPSRSELIRVACRQFLLSELEAAKTFAKFRQQSEFSKIYPPPVEEEPKTKTVKIPWETNAQGEVIEYKTYNIINR